MPESLLNKILDLEAGWEKLSSSNDDLASNILVDHSTSTGACPFQTYLPPYLKSYLHPLFMALCVHVLIFLFE